MLNSDSNLHALCFISLNNFAFNILTIFAQGLTGQTLPKFKYSYNFCITPSVLLCTWWSLSGGVTMVNRFATSHMCPPPSLPGSNRHKSKNAWKSKLASLPFKTNTFWIRNHSQALIFSHLSQMIVQCYICKDFIGWRQFACMPWLSKSEISRHINLHFSPAINYQTHQFAYHHFSPAINYHFFVWVKQHINIFSISTLLILWMARLSLIRDIWVI